jgi:hypothetical protein
MIENYFFEACLALAHATYPPDQVQDSPSVWRIWCDYALH